MSRRTGTPLLLLCALLLLLPVCAAAVAVPCPANEESPTPRLYSIGTVTGEANAPVFYYPSPEENAGDAIGFFNPGAQLLLLEVGSEWCRFSLDTDGYLKTESLCICGTQTTGVLPAIGYAFVTFAPDDPAADTADSLPFLKFLADCDTTGSGDPVTNGMALELIGFCGNMVQLRNSSFNGFLRREHVNLLLNEELFIPRLVTATQGDYRTGDALPPGLYRAATDGGGGATVTLTGGNGSVLVHTVENNQEVSVTMYIPPDTAVSLSAHAVLTSVPREPRAGQAVYPGGRLLPGPDGDMTLASDWGGLYLIRAEAADAYYTQATLWNDKLLEPGEARPLAPGQTITICPRPGELIELHHCRLVSKAYTALETP